MFIYFWERQSVSGGGAERKGDAESEAGSRLSTVSTEPSAGLELTNGEIMTWAEFGCSIDWATQVPHKLFIISQIIYMLVTLSSLSGVRPTLLTQKALDNKIQIGDQDWGERKWCIAFPLDLLWLSLAVSAPLRLVTWLYFLLTWLLISKDHRVVPFRGTFCSDRNIPLVCPIQ